MKSWDTIFKLLFLIFGVAVLSFNILLYNSFEHQKTELNSIKDKQDVEAEFNSNKFKYQSDQIERLSKNLEDAQQQINEQKDGLTAQKDALLEEVEKRQLVANESKAVQTSLIDIKAEADAMKQDMKGWQKDYVSILAQLEKGNETIQGQIKSLHDNIDSFDIPEINQKINSLQAEVELALHPAASDSTATSATPEKTVEHEHFESQ
jgi:chromosome segregation ATPase